MISMTPQFGALVVGLTEFGKFDEGALLKRMGEDIEASTAARIQAGVDPSGAPWAPWSPQYAKSRGVGRMFDRSGATRASLTTIVNDANLRVGVTPFYVRFLQRGSRRGPKTLSASAFKKASIIRRANALSGKHSRDMPARKLLGITEADEDKILERIGEAIEAQVARAS